jgi:hypothetical protein
MTVMDTVAPRPEAGRRVLPFLDPLRSTATIAAVLLISLVFVLSLVTLLSYFKFESSLTAITERRVGLIVERAKNSIESVMRLGLKLEDIEAVRGIVEEAGGRDPRIENIHVFRTDRGRHVFASDTAEIDLPVDPAWLAAQAASADGSWRIQSGGRAVVGARLDSSIVEGIGGVAVTYSLVDVIVRIETMRDNLILAAAATVAAFSLIALISAPLMTRGFRRTLGSLADAIDGDTGSDPTAPRLPESLRESVEQFRTTAGEADRELDRLEAALGDRSPTAGPRLAVRA